LWFRGRVLHNGGLIAPDSKKRSGRAAAGEHILHAQTDARLGRIVKVLMDHATVVVSGTKLADEIGTGRSEVWRLVQQLRGLGVEIGGQPATGYRLKTVPDLLLPEVLAPLTRGTIFSAHIRHYFKVGSTNTAAMQAAAEGAVEGSVYLAEQQTAGSGRSDHRWHSAESSGIYGSVILRPPLPPSEALILSLAAGLAVQSAVLSIDPNIPADLKWPNDLLIDGKKFCGILTEMNAEVTKLRYVVIGIGINVNQETFPPELGPVATSLHHASQREWSRVEVCAALLKSLDREYRTLLQRPDARDSVLRRFQERSSSVRGHRVRIEENGDFEGVTDGLDSRGFLQVRTEHGLRMVLSGSVRLL
jgi:BirA family transcriptional regulator, biotin operon repressor / biotin---[acetyl-CoA-carboxylase] ligase